MLFRSVVRSASWCDSSGGGCSPSRVYRLHRPMMSIAAAFGSHLPRSECKNSADEGYGYQGKASTQVTAFPRTQDLPGQGNQRRPSPAVVRTGNRECSITTSWNNRARGADFVRELCSEFSHSWDVQDLSDSAKVVAEVDGLDMALDVTS